MANRAVLLRGEKTMPRVQHETAYDPEDGTRWYAERSLEDYIDEYFRYGIARPVSGDMLNKVRARVKYEA